MNIDIKVIDHKDQRYETVGDWQVTYNSYTKDYDFKFLVSNLGDANMNFLILLHELIECKLCFLNDITQYQVDQFDMQHPELSEPGEDPRAPYHKEHMIADSFERMMAIHLGVDWIEYGKRVKSLLQKDTQ